MLWLPMAFLSALFTGITAILRPSAASAPRAQPQPQRTGLVLIFSWLMVLERHLRPVLASWCRAP